MDDNKFSFIRAAAACPITNVADINFNMENIKKCVNTANDEHSKVLVFPEMCVTSYTCADMFLQEKLLSQSMKALEDFCSYTRDKDILIALGAPLMYGDCLFNSAFIFHKGILLGIVPKSYIPNYTEFYEKRWFTPGLNIINEHIDLGFQNNVPFGTNLIFTCGPYKIGFEICEDLWVTIPPSSYLSLLGANIIGNLSASNEIVSKADYRCSLVKSQSARCMCSYVYSSSGVFESSTDLVFSGHMLIAENGVLMKENKRFQRNNEVVSSIIDIDKLNMERLKNVSFRDSTALVPYKACNIKFQFDDISFGHFDRYVDKHPFVPSDESLRDARCKEIFSIQVSALAKRFTHTNAQKAVIGISGGLDSTLALLSTIKTFDILKKDRKDIIAITMPGFGTTDRTYNNAINLCKNLKTDLREINIKDACLQHFKDINHPVSNHDVTYENVQARERTQILMDIANKEKGLVIGTGDLSELAIGWCTYNGDHMSMYGINCSIPKTLVRYLVRYAAEKETDKNTSDILLDILDTPVSPELLPKDNDGNISQKTEDIVGPYELHDFFLYYFIRQGASPQKILYLACIAFKGDYEPDTIKYWLDKFIRRFFTQQFKRSAIPDGPKVGTVSLSPRGDLRMPSDASYTIWKI